MSATDAIAWVERAWGTAQSSATGARTGITAALFALGPGKLEGEAPPNDDHHILAVAQSSYEQELWEDGRHRYSTLMTPGALVLNAAGRKLRAINAGPCTILHIYVPTVLVAETLMSEGSGDRDVEFVSPDSRLQDAALSRVSDQIFSELHNPAAFPRLRVDALGLTVVDALLQRHSNIAARWSATHPERGGLAPWQLKRAQEAMLSQLGADLGLDDLAAVAGCSTTHFSRAFKQSTGIAPFYWLAERRIDKAKELLADPRLSLAEIALAVGFSAQPHFTTAFKRATGTTPGEWRRQRLF